MCPHTTTFTFASTFERRKVFRRVVVVAVDRIRAWQTINTEPFIGEPLSIIFQHAVELFFHRIQPRSWTQPDNRSSVFMLEHRARSAERNMLTGTFAASAMRLPQIKVSLMRVDMNVDVVRVRLCVCFVCGFGGRRGATTREICHKRCERFLPSPKYVYADEIDCVAREQNKAAASTHTKTYERGCPENSDSSSNLQVEFASQAAGNFRKHPRKWLVGCRKYSPTEWAT